MSDAATQQQAAAPQRGMRRIPFPLESYQHPSLPLSAKRLVNLMAEQEPQDARTVAALVPTPGLVVSMTIGAGPIRAINSDMPGLIYFASGDHFYRLQYATNVLTDLGYIGVPGLDTAGNDTLRTSIAVGATAVVVCVPPNAFTCAHDSALNQIGGTFPGAQSVTFLDGYFAFTATGDSGQWFISGLLDPASFDALDFAYADAAPNVAQWIITHRGELWLFGEGAIEIWRDAGVSGLETTSGTSYFPFARQSGGVIWIGCANNKSVARVDGSVWWLGTDYNVYRSNGYRAQRVSTHAIESIINNEGGQVTCALTYTQEGHSFYVLTIQNRTLVYDVATGVWHERSSSADGGGPWRPRSVSTATAALLFGDSGSGKVYQAIPRYATDDGVTIVRQFTTPPIYAGTRRAFCSRLEIEMEVGQTYAPTGMSIQWSNDAINWDGGPRALSAGASWDVRHRVYTTRLGSFRQRLFRVTAYGVATFYAVDAEITAGDS